MSRLRERDKQPSLPCLQLQRSLRLIPTRLLNGCTTRTTMELSIPQSTSSNSISALVPSSSTSSTTFSLEPFRAYLAQLVPLLLGSTAGDIGDELDTMWDAGGDEDAVGERVSKWAADPSAGVVYIVKSRDARDERGTSLFSCHSSRVR